MSKYQPNKQITPHLFQNFQIYVKSPFVYYYLYTTVYYYLYTTTTICILHHVFTTTIYICMYFMTSAYNHGFDISRYKSASVLLLVFFLLLTTLLIWNLRYY